jgi:hypothetical protein
MVKRVTVLSVLLFGMGLALAAPVPENFAIKLEKVAGQDMQVMVVGSWTIDHIQGWSWGVCSNKDQITIGDGSCTGDPQGSNPCKFAARCPFIACTEEIKTAGVDPDDPSLPGPVGFHSINIYDGGLTQGVIIDMQQQKDLPIDDRFEMFLITYQCKAGFNGTARLEFCDTLGSPPVETTFVVDGFSYAPATKTGLDLTPCGGAVCPTALNLHMTASAGAVNVLLDTPDAKTPSGFSFGVAHDNTNMRVQSIEPGSAITGLATPAYNVKVDGYWGPEIIGSQGGTVGCVIDLVPDGQNWITLPGCTADQQIAVVTYTCEGGGTQSGTVTFSDTLGTPPRETVIDFDGTSEVPTKGAGVTVTATCGGVVDQFIRGDANQDGKYNVSDGVAIAKAVFGQGSKYPLIQGCKDSADVNDDGTLSTADAIYILAYLFANGTAIPAPFKTCGADPTTTDALDCPTFNGCP